MSDLFLLISPKLLGLRNRMSRSGKAGRRRAAVLAGLGLFFWAGIFVLSCRVLMHFRAAEMIGDIIARHLLGMILLTLFSLLVFSHIITGLSNLFLSKDLEFCHAAPVSTAELFLSRAVLTALDSSWMLLIFGVPVLLAYAYIYRPGWGFYVSACHLHVAMVGIAAGVGILVTMIVVQIFPARRTRDILVLLSLFGAVALYMLFRFLRPERLVDPGAFFTILQYMDALKGTDSPYLPTRWITEILWGELSGSPSREAAFLSLLTWATGAALTVIGVWTAEATYRQGFSKAQEAGRRREGGRQGLDAVVRIVTRPFGGDVAALMAKDIRTFFRDHTQWSQVLLLAALVAVYLYNFSVLPLDRSPIRLDFLQNHLAFLNMGLAGFVLSAVSARFVYTAVSAEGEAFWVLRASPMTLRRFLWTKYAFFLPPMLLLVEILIVLTNRLLEVTPLMMGLTAVTMFFLTFGILSIAIGFGAAYPDFGHQNIAQVATGFGGVLFMMVSTLFVASVIVLEAGPVYILFMADFRGIPVSMKEWLFITASFCGAATLMVLAVAIPLRIGQRALARREG
jgi:ABC-2 type transport system permease protein